MKTVRDLYVDAQAMKRQGVPTREIATRLLDLAHDSGLRHVEVTGGTDVVALLFPTGERIAFDGEEWRHTRP